MYRIAAALNNCKIRFISEQHSVRSRVAGPGTTIKCREGGEGGHNARNSESA